MTTHIRTLIIAGLVGAVGCNRTIAKINTAPGDVTVPGIGEGATATAADVRVVARAQAWKWDPIDLKTKATPFLIEFHNEGTHPVLVRYNRITLTDADGHVFNAMPPYDVDARLTESYTVMNPYYGFDRFTIAPYLSRWYPRFSRYDGAFVYDPAYYSPYVTRYRSVRLPTADMVQRALPEGVLSPGGTAAGFVYFEPLHPDAKTLTLSIDMVDAVTGNVLGTTRIPFTAS